eukprot:scaffold17139_cov123-Isochrysis_galbana.AAC.10
MAKGDVVDSRSCDSNGGCSNTLRVDALSSHARAGALANSQALASIVQAMPGDDPGGRSGDGLVSSLCPRPCRPRSAPAGAVGAPLIPSTRPWTFSALDADHRDGTSIIILTIRTPSGDHDAGSTGTLQDPCHQRLLQPVSLITKPLACILQQQPLPLSQRLGRDCCREPHAQRREIILGRRRSELFLDIEPLLCEALEEDGRSCAGSLHVVHIRWVVGAGGLDKVIKWDGRCELKAKTGRPHGQGGCTEALEAE